MEKNKKQHSINGIAADVAEVLKSTVIAVNTFDQVIKWHWLVTSGFLCLIPQMVMLEKAQKPGRENERFFWLIDTGRRWFKKKTTKKTALSSTRFHRQFFFWNNESKVSTSISFCVARINRLVMHRNCYTPSSVCHTVCLSDTLKCFGQCKNVAHVFFWKLFL